MVKCGQSIILSFAWTSQFQVLDASNIKSLMNPDLCVCPKILISLKMYKGGECTTTQHVYRAKNGQISLICPTSFLVHFLFSKLIRFLCSTPNGSNTFVKHVLCGRLCLSMCSSSECMSCMCASVHLSSVCGLFCVSHWSTDHCGRPACRWDELCHIVLLLVRHT